MSRKKILAAFAATAVSFMLIIFLLSLQPELEGHFIMTRIAGGVMIEGTVTNSGWGSAGNVSIHFTLYDYRGDIAREWTHVLGYIGPHSERTVQLRFRVDARDFTWYFIVESPPR